MPIVCMGLYDRKIELHNNISWTYFDYATEIPHLSDSEDILLNIDFDL